MAEKSKLQQMYEREGLDRLWNWAQKKPVSRFKRLSQWATKKIDWFEAAVNKDANERDRAEAFLHDLAEEVERVLERRQKLWNQVGRERDKERPDQQEIDKLLGWIKNLHKEMDDLRRRQQSREVQKAKAMRQAKKNKEIRKQWISRRTKWRKARAKAIKKAKAGQKPKFEDWMVPAGTSSNVVPSVKDFLARGVVNFDLYVTSMKRTYVPPGGSTTSYHLQTPGKAGDIAGARMTSFQISEYNRNHGNGNCLELFGPDNYKNLKYGNTITLYEGSGLENLHDTHVHGAFGQ